MNNLRIGALCMALAMLLAGCSKSIDINKTADTILANITFDDEMIKAEASVIDNLYTLPTSGIEEYVIYVSASGATANEFAIFRVKDSSAATALTTALATRTETLKTNFENYVPDELSRINNKLILQKGDYVLFAVTNSNADIQDIFNNALS